MKVNLLVLTFVFCLARNNLSQIDFTSHTITSSANNAQSVYGIDLDGDEDIDVLSASFNDAGIVWYENDGNESFTPHTITTSTSGANSVFAIDVDSDEDIDVLSSSIYDDKISWYENDGNENFTTHIITTSANNAYSVFAIDVDSDGDMDVLSASAFDDKIAWYENDGSENFSPHTITTTADWAQSVYAIDVDGDGEIDVLSASGYDDKIAWYENDGNENFTTHIITTSADYAESVYAIDVDSDDDIDVLSASRFDHKIAWYENDGNENFTAHTITTSATNAYSVIAIDIDSDGDIDVIGGFNSKIEWYENDGNENFTTHIITTVNEGRYLSIYTTDVDGDEDIDVLSASNNDDKINWYKNLSLITSLIVSDASGFESSMVLFFGQHTEATDSIDAILGEYELPPTPIAGNFDARLKLPTNPQVSSLKDLRDRDQTDIIWDMTFQPSSAGYPMTFTWDSTSFPEGTFYLKDLINGSYVFVNMKNQSKYTLNEPAITSLNISYRGLCTTVSLNKEWNMISVPLLVEDMSVSNLFSTAISEAYSYSDEYVIEDTLVGGAGYWLKFGTSEEIQICGLSLGDTVSVTEGWNMLGVYENDISISQITTTPPGIIATYFFGFEDGYYIAYGLESGMGYWVRVTENGVLNLNGGTLAKGEDKQPIAELSKNWGKIKITDREGKTVTLFATEEETDLSLYELPPVPPEGIFDARYSSGRMVEELSSEKIIQISSDSYPITIRAEGLNITVRDRINGELLNEELTDGEEIRITNSKITSVEVAGKVTGGLPVSYELYQNYPNPFNPTTTIKFAVPEESDVNLSIYNVLGELVTTLINGQMKAGYYEYEFNASEFSSGVYLYSIKAGNFVETKKMVLMK